MGFQAPDLSPSPARYVQLWGQEKTGKTFAALSFPPPISLLSFDGNYLIPWQQSQVQGRVASYLPSLQDTDATLQERLQEVKRDWVAACDQAAQDGGTVVLDTETELWRLVQEVEVRIRREQREAAAIRAGKKLPLPSRWDYGPANRLMEQILAYAAHRGINCVVISRAKKLYLDGKETEHWVPHGFTETGYLVPIRIQTLHDREKGFRIKFDTCAPDMSFVGLTLPLGPGESLWETLKEGLG